MTHIIFKTGYHQQMRLENLHLLTLSAGDHPPTLAKNIFMRLLILLTVALFSFDSSAQCYEKYRKAFNERDAFDVTDSVYEDVIISVREGTSNDCFLGKVTVKGGKVLLDNFYVKLEDGSYENIGIRFKTFAPVEVKKGISQIILDKRDNLYNVIFLDHLKPPKKGYMKAPDFDLD